MTKRWVSLCLTAALLLSMLGAVMLPAVLAASATVTGGKLTAVTAEGDLPRAENLLAGKIPTIGDKKYTLDGKVVTGNTTSNRLTTLYRGDAAALTDGLVQGIHTIATAETVEDGMAAVMVAQNAWSGDKGYDGWGDHVWLVYDLGESKTIQSLLIANSLTG